MARRQIDGNAQSQYRVIRGRSGLARCVLCAVVSLGSCCPFVSGQEGNSPSAVLGDDNAQILTAWCAEAPRSARINSIVPLRVHFVGQEGVTMGDVHWREVLSTFRLRVRRPDGTDCSASLSWEARDVGAFAATHGTGGVDVTLEGFVGLDILPTGFLFCSEGEYALEVQDTTHVNARGRRDGPSRIVIVGGGAARDLEALSRLDDIAMARYDYNRAGVVEKYGSQYHAASELLRYVLGRRTPHLVVPEERPEDQREARLVDMLRQWATDYADAVHVTIVSRFLGLVRVKSFEYEVSRMQHARLIAKEPPLSSDELRALPDYREAVAYLAAARDNGQLGTTIATYELGRVLAMGRDWGQFDRCMTALQQEPTSQAKAMYEQLEKVRTRVLKRQQRRSSSASYEK